MVFSADDYGEPPASAPPEGFRWGGKSWGASDKAQFNKWLQAHGTSFDTWLRNHPAAGQRVFGETAPERRVSSE